MKTIKERSQNNIPVIKRDKALDRLNDVVLFPEKVEKAKQTIDQIGLPKKKQDK